MALKHKLAHKINNKTKPIGSLGKLEDLALKIGTILDSESPELKNPHFLVFAGDHGLTEEGISPFPKEVTAQMVFNFLQGGAAINVFCKQHDIKLNVIDAGVDFDFQEATGLVHKKVAHGTRNMLKAPAMELDQCMKAIDHGAMLIDELQNCNIVGFGEMGIGNTSSAALLMSRFCELSIEQCVGRGTGCDDKALQKKLEVLQKVLKKHNGINQPIDTLATFGGLEIAMMVGAMIQANKKGMIILIDGFIATAALLAANAIDKAVLKNCIFTHQSEEQGHQKMLQHLGADPILHLGLRLGEGTGAALAYPLLQSAVAFLNEMASFESAGVSNKE